MKRRDLIKLLEKNGFRYDRDGGNYDIYYREKDKRREAIGRHNELPELLAKKIIKRNKLK